MIVLCNVMGPKVTVGICARNSQATLASALDSISKQDYPHDLMEIVFVDDGSDDRTLEIFESYVAKIDILSRIFKGQWRGLGCARNTIIKNANGMYVIWVDADEILESDFVKNQVNLMEQNPDAGIASAKWGIRPNENLVLTLELIPGVVEYSTQDWRLTSKLPGTGGAIYRVTAARQVGGFDESLTSGCEDIDLASRIRKAGWLILRGNATFYELNSQLSTWSVLWRRYFNRGIHSRRLYRKAEGFFSLYHMNPFASLIAGFLYSFAGYRKTKLKVSFLLPVHFAFKMTAWFYGFSKG